MSRWRLEAAVFLCGAVVMAFELAGSRVLAPAVGTSLPAWTALIGVILASLSVGYWLGGRAADRRPDAGTLAWVIIAAAAAIAATAAVHTGIVGVVGLLVRDVRLAAVAIALPLFAPAALLLGAVSPWAAKLRIRDLATDGAAVGRLAAISTAGSIAGTFAAGYVLIAAVGTAATLATLAALTACAALLVDASGRRAIAAVAVTAAAALAIGQPQPDGVRSVDTGYQRALIRDIADPATGRPIRIVTTDPFGIQGAQFTDGGGGIVFPYIRAFASVGSPAMRSALVVGGATYTVPRDLLARLPDVRVTVVELDPGMTAIARRFFGLQDDPRMRIVHADGRVFLNRTDERYDAIYLDAFSGVALPFHLLTREAVLRMRAALADGGVVVANLIGAPEGDASGLLRAAEATFSSVFAHVRLFPLGTAPAAVQNVMLVASDREVAASAGPGIALAGGAVLTDDRAPVEVLQLPVVRRR